jgi:hypothetical protein
VASSLAAKKPFGGDGVGTLRGDLCVFPALEKIEPSGLGLVVMTGGYFDEEARSIDGRRAGSA